MVKKYVKVDLDYVVQNKKCGICKTGKLEYDPEVDGTIICPDCAKKHPERFDSEGIFITKIPRKPQVIAKLAWKAYAMVMEFTCGPDEYYGYKTRLVDGKFKKLKINKREQWFLLNVDNLFHLGHELFYYDCESTSGVRAIFEMSCELIALIQNDLNKLISVEVAAEFEPYRQKLYAVEWGN